MSPSGTKRQCRHARAFRDWGYTGCAIRLPAIAARDPVSDGTHRLFPELGVDRLCHRPTGHSRP